MAERIGHVEACTRRDGRCVSCAVRSDQAALAGMTVTFRTCPGTSSAVRVGRSNAYGAGSAPAASARPREVPLAHADLRVLPLQLHHDVPHIPSGGFWANSQGVVVVQLLGDPGEDLDEVPDVVREEEGPARLLRHLAQEAARAAGHEALGSADAHAVDGGLHGARVIDHILLLHGAGGVGAVGEDDQRLAPGLVLDAVQPVMDGVVEAGPAPGCSASTNCSRRSTSPENSALPLMLSLNCPTRPGPRRPLCTKVRAASCRKRMLVRMLPLASSTRPRRAGSSPPSRRGLAEVVTSCARRPRRPRCRGPRPCRGRPPLSWTTAVTETISTADSKVKGLGGAGPGTGEGGRGADQREQRHASGPAASRRGYCRGGRRVTRRRSEGHDQERGGHDTGTTTPG